MNRAWCITKPDIIFMNHEAMISGTSINGPIEPDKDTMSFFGLKDLTLESVLTRDNHNPQSYTMLDYLKENPQEYKEVKGTYDKIMGTIINGPLNNFKAGVLSSMVTAGQRGIKQVILVSNKQDAQDTIAFAKDILRYFNDIYKELDLPAISVGDMIDIGVNTKDYAYKTCWLLADNGDHLNIGIRSGCIPFFVGDVSVLPKTYQEMIERGQVIVVKFSDFNRILISSF